MKLKLKSCIKCKGDLAWEHDQYGDYWACIQCGRIEGERFNSYEETSEIKKITNLQYTL